MLLKSGIIVSFMTFLSRILGLVRDVVIAQFMGAGAGADVFFFANKIPNFLRRLFSEGAFAQAFIPVLTEVQANNDKAEFKQFIAKVSGTLGVIVFLTTVLGVVGSSVIAAIFGTGWFIAYLNDEPAGDKYLLASTMLKITFPYLFFVTLVGLSGAILNTLNKFAVSSFTPVILNIVIIICAVILHNDFSTPAFALAWGVFIGGVVQLVFQIPFLLKVGALVRPQWGWHDPNVKKVRTLMIPALFGVSVSQINLLVDTLIASFLMTGSISWLYYSDRLMEFPLGLFGIAIATIILPALSKDHIAQDKLRFQANMNWAIKMVCVLGIPSAIGLIVLAEPLLSLIFERGAFTASDVSMASMSLIAYASGLFSFMLIKVLAPGFFAQQDTKTPVKIGIIAMVANMGFNVIFAIPYGFVGLAIATALSATLNAGLLYYHLHQRDMYRLSLATLLLCMRVVVSSLIMGGVLMYVQANIVWSELTFVLRLSLVVQWLILAAVVYFVSLKVFGVTLSAIRSPPNGEIK